MKFFVYTILLYEIYIKILKKKTTQPYILNPVRSHEGQSCSLWIRTKMFQWLQSTYSRLLLVHVPGLLWTFLIFVIYHRQYMHITNGEITFLDWWKNIEQFVWITGRFCVQPYSSSECCYERLITCLMLTFDLWVIWTENLQILVEICYLSVEGLNQPYSVDFQKMPCENRLNLPKKYFLHQTKLFLNN